MHFRDVQETSDLFEQSVEDSEKTRTKTRTYTKAKPRTYTKTKTRTYKTTKTGKLSIVDCRSLYTVSTN